MSSVMVTVQWFEPKWESRAACGSEPSELWDKSGAELSGELAEYQRQVCNSCSVFRDCAGSAVFQRVQSETRAGRRVPAKRRERQWLDVMAELADVAGVPAPASVIEPSGIEIDSLDQQILSERRKTDNEDSEEDLEHTTEVDGPLWQAAS